MIDRALLMDSQQAIGDFFAKLSSVKQFFKWSLGENNRVQGNFVYLNIHDVFDDPAYHVESPLEAVAFPFIVDGEHEPMNDDREIVSFLGLTFEEGEIIRSAIHNDFSNEYFVPQVRQNLLVELGLEDRD